MRSKTAINRRKILLNYGFCANLEASINYKNYSGVIAMKNPLESITGTIISHRGFGGFCEQFFSACRSLRGV
jgi:hypothetical protein